MRRVTFLLALVALAACGESPTQPTLDVPVSLAIVPVGGGLMAETFDLADGSGCEFYPPGTFATPEGLTFTTFTGTVRSGPAHSGSCAFEGFSLDLQNAPGSDAVWTSVWILPTVDPAWADPTIPVDIFLYGPFTATTVDVPVDGWSELVLPTGPTVTGWSIASLFGAVYDDLTYGVPAADPEGEPGEDPVTRDDCEKGGWQAFGFRNQGQCVRFVETGKDSR